MGPVLLIALIVFWCIKLDNEIALIVRCVLTGIFAPLYIAASVGMFYLSGIEVEQQVFYLVFGIIFIILSVALCVRLYFDINKIRHLRKENSGK